METRLLRQFQRQVWLQGKFVSHAAAIFDATWNSRYNSRPADYSSVASLSRDEMLARSTEIALEPAIAPWFAIQSLLSATANITKALWGDGGKLTAEREPLRLSLAIDDSSPLKTTTMRNNFDHFDDRLDKWSEGGTGTIVDLSFGDPTTIISGPGATGKDSGFFRNFNPATGDLIFWGQSYHLPTIVQEVARITPLALRESVK